MVNIQNELKIFLYPTSFENKNRIDSHVADVLQQRQPYLQNGDKKCLHLLLVSNLRYKKLPDTSGKYIYTHTSEEGY